MIEIKKGTVVGHWRIEAPLGTGGQAGVWRVRYTGDKHSAPAAVKVCSSQSEKAQERFAREISFLRERAHPGIVRIRDNGMYLGSPFYVMELATTTLDRVFRGESAGVRLILESREVLLRLFRQASEAVAHLHSHDVLHRDIKPSNVLLMLDPPEPMRAVLCDLGVAANEPAQGELTATHETVGTPAFRAPEAITGSHTKRSDVYSLGKTLECVLNREVPSAMGPQKCLRDQRLTGETWDALDAVLGRACAYDPADRFEDGAAFVGALPELVVGLAGRNAPALPLQHSTTIVLTPAERVTLSSIVAGCPAADSNVDLYRVQRSVRLSEYAFSISTRRLEGIGFVETFVGDSAGERYSLVQPTPAGIRWAHEHHDEMVAAMEEAEANAPVYDDIPF